MRALVTGAAGFVGRHLVAHLRELGHDTIGTALSPGPHYVALDVRDPAAVRRVLADAQPEWVFHLAGQASPVVGQSEATETFKTNALGTLHVIEGLRSLNLTTCRVVLASSGTVYGASSPEEMPLREELPRNPTTIYGASKLAAEALVQAEWRSFGTPTVVARAFNHVGPGQAEQFMVPSWALQLARIAAGAPRVLSVGNLELERDFIDVRDAARAYVALAERGQAGEVYNVGRGSPVRLKWILETLIGMSGQTVEVRSDPTRIRRNEVPLQYADVRKIFEATGWRAEIPLETTIADEWLHACRVVRNLDVAGTVS